MEADEATTAGEQQAEEEPQAGSAAPASLCEWPSVAAGQPAFQAAPGYASSSPLAYMWGSQPLMPPFGAFTVLGQSAEAAAAAAHAAAASEGQAPSIESPAKCSSSSHRNADAKRPRAASAESGGGGSEGSSGGSDDRNAEKNHGFFAQRNAFHRMALEVNAGGIFGNGPTLAIPAAASAPGALTGSTSYLVDCWSGGIPRVLSKTATDISVGSQTLVPATPNTSFVGAAGREGPDLWSQDERELKRQRRKQSNRESARRSRLRKQAECEELSSRVDALAVENGALRGELNRLIEERNNLALENATLLERVLEKRCEEDRKRPAMEQASMHILHNLCTAGGTDS